MSSIRIYSTDSEPVVITNAPLAQVEELRDRLEDTSHRYMRVGTNHGMQATLFTAHITKIEVTP